MGTGGRTRWNVVTLKFLIFFQSFPAHFHNNIVCFRIRIQGRVALFLCLIMDVYTFHVHVFCLFALTIVCIVLLTLLFLATYDACHFFLLLFFFFISWYCCYYLHTLRDTVSPICRPSKCHKYYTSMISCEKNVHQKVCKFV